MGWQDDPVIAAPGTASPPPPTPAPTGGGASTPAPAWMSDPVIPPTAAAAPAADAPQQISHVSSFGPTGNAIANAVIGFDEQARRAATMGLSDKIGALVPAINSAVAKGAGAVGNALGITSPSQDSTPSPSFSDAYHDELGKERAAGDAYAAAHPYISPIATGLGLLAGGVRPAGVTEAAATNTAANMAALKAGTDAVPMATTAAGLSAAAQAANKTAAMAVPTSLAGKVGQGIVGGAEIGGISGLGASDDKSLGGDLLSTAAGAGVGAATGGGTAALADKVISPIANWAARATGSQSAIDNQALTRLAQRVAQDKAGNGPGAQDILDALNAAPAGEKNVIADFGGGNVLGEAGRVVRAPGPGKTVGLNLLADRAKGEPETVANLVQSGISGGGPAYNASQALMDSRAAAAAPKYEAAGIPSDPAQYSSAPVIDNPAVTRLLEKSTAVKSAIAQAKGLPDYADLPSNNLVLLDKAYKNIGGSAAEASRAGNGESARDLNNLRI